MKIIREVTRHVSGCDDKQTIDGHTKSGDPSPATAYGCFLGFQAAVKYRLKRDGLNGLTVGIQGLGNVGYRLAGMLAEAGARLLVTDINSDALHRASRELDARAVETDDIYRQQMDVFVPCAMGAIINPRSLAHLQAAIIAGSANNQLDTAETGRLLHARGICYAPDYVISAGGIIDVFYEKQGHYDTDTVNEHIRGIYDTLMALFERSDREDKATSDLADTMAREKLQSTGAC
jgi:leucine dehydrogenase